MRTPESTSLSRGGRALVALSLLAVAAADSVAGGPRKVNSAGAATVWNNGVPVLYYVDQGELGSLSNERASCS